MSDSTADRSLPPTPRRREAARRAGLVPTATLPAWGASTVVTILLLPRWLEATAGAAAAFFQSALPAAVRGEDTVAVWGGAVAVLGPTVTIVCAATAAAVAVRMACDGVQWHPGRAAFDLRRIAPWTGLARILSADTLRTIAGGAIGLALVAAAVVWSCHGLAWALATDAMATTQGSLETARRILLPVAGSAAAMGLAGWALARRRAERRLWMTPEEFAAEQRAVEAGPRVRFHAPRRQAAGGR